MGKRYKTLRLIGQGGMGQVWRATDAVLHMDVALKFIRPDLAEEKAFARRFRREVRALVRLAHPNVVRLLDYHEMGGLCFYAMEFVEGRPLDEILEEGAPEPAEAARIVALASAGLAAAHDAGIVHRDIKPGNLIVANDGTVRLVDFGLVRIDSLEDLTRLTQTGHYIGTMRYITPEVLKGKEAGAPSDVYQMGLVCYETLTGRHAFHEFTLPQVMSGAAFDGVVDPHAFNPAVDEALSEIVMAPLAIRAADRPSAADFSDALQDWLGAKEGKKAPRLGDRGRKRKARPGADDTTAPPREGDPRPRVPRLRGGAVEPGPDGALDAVPEKARWPVVAGVAAAALAGFLLPLAYSTWRSPQAVLPTAVVSTAAPPSAVPTAATPITAVPIEMVPIAPVTVTVAPSATPKPTARIIPAPPAGRLALDVEPADARVTVNGEVVPVESWFEHRLAPGPYRVVVTSPGYERQIRAGTVTAEKEESLLIRLSRVRGKHPPGTVRTDGSGMKLVYAPPGLFYLGCPETEVGGFSWERPPRRVAIEKGFWIGACEVTLGQWMAVMKGSAEFDAWRAEWKKWVDGGFPLPAEPPAESKIPAILISWEDSRAFCRRLTSQEGETYRLPTEAEWEYACRAGTREARHGPLDEVAWWKGGIRPVATRKANAWGLYDTLGNVWEWAADRQGPYPASNKSRKLLAQGLTPRIFRGGGAWGDERYCRAASRSVGKPEHRAGLVGFRVVCEE